MKITGGITENGIVVGNAYNKYESKNPLVKWIMNGFELAILKLLNKVSPTSIHEIGCGEGYWVLRWCEEGLIARGCDFSSQAIAIARENAAERNLPQSLFEVKNIYDLEPRSDSADLVVCCEVLEHLENPDLALQSLQRIVNRYLIVSVPREPLWCALNLARGKYIADCGNTPGHIQHWSRDGFIQLVSKYFDVVEVKSPLPWTLLLVQARLGEK